MNVRKPQGPLVYKNPFLSELKNKSVAAASRRNLSPKAGHLVKVPPTRPTRTICEERLACKRPLRIAVYTCTDCRTLQCDLCETLIHENPKFLFHERKKLQFPAENVICELNCETKNLADTFCKACDKRLCFACDLITHQTKSFKVHYRVPFELDEFFSLPQGQETVSCNPNQDDYPSWNYQDFHSIIPQEQFLPTSNQGPETKLNSIDQEDSDSSGDYNSIIDNSNMMSMNSIPDVLSSTGTTKTSLESCKSFLLVNDAEQLQIKTEEDFIQALNCKPEAQLKVLSIFGNTGEGKSYTLNHTFFQGAEMFVTNDTQDSCTVGVWGAYKQMDQCGLLILDTEGLLGLTENHNQRSRLLLKVLAVSDVIVYRTRAERLHTDMYTFLGDASVAYTKHFALELKAAMKRFNLDAPVSSVGPSVIIFHETLNTKTLTTDEKKGTPEEQLKSKFRKHHLTIDAYSNLQYVGTQTKKDGNTSFDALALAIKETLKSSTVRSCRTPSVIYQLLKALNEKFSGDIDKTIPSCFLVQYLTCNAVCQACNKRCVHSTNHASENVKHDSPEKCQYQHQFDNKIFFCRACNTAGKTVQVFPRTCTTSENSWLGLVKYAWSGYVIECPTCGVIYRSREHWYGNKDPCELTVNTEYCHVWSGEVGNTQPNPNVAQRMIDSVTCISDVVSSISAKPTKTITSWVADQLAPEYWKPNSLILKCAGTKCNGREFGAKDQKHHCRACGDGFCADCSSKTKPVPWRGWGSSPVRVCDTCYEKSEQEVPEVEESNKEQTVTARKVGEVLHSAIGTVALVGIHYPKELIKYSARPSYWVPDEDIKNCCICKNDFSDKLPLHHCRACGQGVCEECSPSLKAVPSRGWDYPVRVCKSCENKDNL